MNLELRHLRALIAVADADTFTEAAAALGITQPTLSRTIAQLEGIVGRRLVERTTRHIALTDHGRSLVAESRAVLGRLDRSLAALTADRPATLRVGWTWAAFGEQTAPLLRAWDRDATTQVQIIRSLQPFQALDDGDLDAAIVRKALPAEIDYERYHSAHLYTERLVVAVAHDSALADRTRLRLADLASRRVALCATTPTATLDLWEGSAVTPDTVLVDGTDDWLARIVLQEAVGVTSLTTSYNYPHPEIRYLHIEDSPTVEVMLAWPLQHSHPEAETFARFARRYFRELPRSQAPAS